MEERRGGLIVPDVFIIDKLKIRARCTGRVCNSIMTSSGTNGTVKIPIGSSGWETTDYSLIRFSLYDKLTLLNV